MNNLILNVDVILKKTCLMLNDVYFADVLLNHQGLIICDQI